MHSRFLDMRAETNKVSAISVLIADDEDAFAELVETLLTSDGRFEVVGRARDGKEAVGLARSLLPEVIVMDIGMPVLDGIEATRRIRRANPAIGVVIFTGSDEARDIQRAREVGAAAYVQKMHIDAVLLAAIERAADRDASSSSRATRPLAATVAIA